MVEGLGLLASVLVAVSLMMKNVWRLRWINMAGALLFAAYGYLVHAFPVLAVNAFIVCINAYFLVRMSTEKDAFSILEVKDARGDYLQRFLRYHHADIERFAPGFEPAQVGEGVSCLFVLRNLVPVGLFVYRAQASTGEIEVLLDFVIPEYRDFENGAFLYSSGEAARVPGARGFVARSTSAEHGAYLRRVGFREEEPGTFRRAVEPSAKG